MLCNLDTDSKNQQSRVDENWLIEKARREVRVGNQCLSEFLSVKWFLESEMWLST